MRVTHFLHCCFIFFNIHSAQREENVLMLLALFCPVKAFSVSWRTCARRPPALSRPCLRCQRARGYLWCARLLIRISHIRVWATFFFFFHPFSLQSLSHRSRNTVSQSNTVQLSNPSSLSVSDWKKQNDCMTNKIPANQQSQKKNISNKLQKVSFTFSSTKTHHKRGLASCWLLYKNPSPSCHAAWKTRRT